MLPRTADGFGRIEPTPPELVKRRFTLPDTLPPLPGTGFASRVTTPAPAAVIARSTWKQGCPVAATDLSWVRLTFVGFDGKRHTGELLVNSSVADDLVAVFRQLYAAKFPIEEMRITRADELDAPPTGDGNNTGAFNCRPTVGRDVVLAARLRARHRREPVPEPVHEGRPGAAGARVGVPPARVGAPRE